MKIFENILWVLMRQASGARGRMLIERSTALVTKRENKTKPVLRITAILDNVFSIILHLHEERNSDMIFCQAPKHDIGHWS